MREPIVVVGAGPVGLTLALELAAAGTDTDAVVVLDRLPQAREAAMGSTGTASPTSCARTACSGRRRTSRTCRWTRPG